MCDMVVGMDAPDQAVVAALTPVLVAALTARMIAAGWSVDPVRGVLRVGSDLSTFRHPVDGEFTAEVEFMLVGGWVKGDPPVTVAARVAVDYEPAYRLAPVVLGTESSSECELDVGELLDPPGRLVVTMSKASQADDVAEQLVGPVLAHALDYVRAHANLEELLDAARSDPEMFDYEIEQVPLLLAAAGRHDEARAALARYQATGESAVIDVEYRRFVRQLTLWMDAGGVLPDPPTGPIRPSVDWSERESPSFSDVRRKARARREAFDVVRHQAAGRTNDEIRVMLQAEYDRRGVPYTPLSIEVGVEAIARRQTPLGSVTAAVQGVAALANLSWRAARGIGTVVTVLRGRDLPDRPGPVEWLQPPEEAAYPVRRGGRDRDNWMAVELDDDATEFIQRAHTAARPVIGGPAALRPIDTVILDGWLSWDSAPPTATSRLIVHLGDQRVGTLTPDDTRRFGPIMETAHQRHELPRMKARLTSFNREPRNLLEIQAPT
jgi:hypothetical protein